MDNAQQLQMLKNNFSDCQEMLVALGDENRQNILLALADKSCKEGLRVGEITSKVNLSRPAVSHHLKILKEAHLIKLRQVGTMNFYSADLKTDFHKLNNLMQTIKLIGADE